jgi:hypothetical protein
MPIFEYMFLTARVSRSLDLTGSDWGLRKKTQRQTYRKAWAGRYRTPDKRCQ